MFLLLFLWITFLDWASTPRIANEDNKEQETTTPPQPCIDANWSAGSAFFTLTALIFGYIAHPRGCLFWNRSGRMWRLTPVFAFLELCIVWKRIALSLWKKVPFRVICYTLMAVRVGNSWHPSEIKEFLHKTREDEDEEAQLIPPADTSALDGNTNLDQTRQSDRRQNEDVYPEHSVATTTASSPYRPRAFAPRDELRYHETCDRIFQEHLNIVSDFERGPSFRIFIWIPMVLQATKLVIVGGPGAILTQVAGWVYFIAWLSIEILMITIAERPLTELERTRATTLSRQWRKHFETPDVMSDEFSKTSLEIIPPATFKTAITFGLIIGGCDFFWTVFLCSLSPGSKAGNASTTHLNFVETAVSNLESISLWVAAAVFCFLVMYPGPALFAQRLLHLMWRPLTSYLWFDPGPLWFEDSLGDLEPLWPGYLASYNYFVIFLFHTGIWWVKPFECWETRKPAYYDWLG
ncbi:uncharacterized protein TRUGW13939_00587 [Talaromyces rugulosus]|uniref:Wax synthase domain-containing protein n=1 Tax=Talaromyces rugulosus TaxID=121627 RepID=A0A7H8QHP7_TALRU|nr:uncharacterized protein TRUGW13939_00587 [Talaromyces rugulosus]QKX53508.1 hypothetical protein TRUGW13939_00587 [Talaromyces rugulosus]